MNSLAGQVDLSVVAPVYNEAEGIEEVVRYWVKVLQPCEFTYEIVLANDGSTDATEDILGRLQTEFPFLRYVSYKPNRGYGYALGSAIQASSGQIVVTLDSDGQFDLADVHKLLQTYQNLDFVTGYRVKKADNLFRVLADRGVNLLVRSLFHVSLRDTNCAMKLIRGDLARNLIVEATGYPTPTEITVKLVALGARTAEEGVQHLERLKGQSKLKFLRTSISSFRFLLYLRKRLKLYKAGILNTL